VGAFCFQLFVNSNAVADHRRSRRCPETAHSRGAAQEGIDTTTAAGKCFLDMLGVFAEFETNLRRERQLEGIAKAKVAGVYKGRKPSIDVAKIEALKASGLGPTEIARKLKIGRASVYRVGAQRADAR
jgi:DNA invertase Pin-like site-specific DNA recombinase